VHRAVSNEAKERLFAERRHLQPRRAAVVTVAARHRIRGDLAILKQLFDPAYF